MRVASAAVGILAAAAALSGCGAADSDQAKAPGSDVIMDKSWQIIGMYTTPESGGALSNTVVPAPSLTLGNRGMVGTTGCAQFKARVSYTANGQSSGLNGADAVRIESMDVDTRREDCAGQSLGVHNQLLHLLTEGAVFDMHVDRNNQLVFTLQSDAVDAPALRMVSIGTH